LRLTDIQDKPKLFRHLCWALAEIYQQMPEKGDADQPISHFIDEAHLILMKLVPHY
jgi:hypothetical protein